MDLVAHVDLRDVEKAFTGLDRRAANSRDFFRRQKAPAKRDVRTAGRRQRGPNDERWPGRARSTLARHPGRAGKRLLGALTSTWKSAVSAHGLVLESPIPWARAHHDGATVGNGARLPARPFIGFSDDYVEAATDAYKAWILRFWGRA